MFEPNRPLDTVMYLRMRADEKKAIEGHALARGMTPSEVIREALSRYKIVPPPNKKRNKT